MDLGLRGKRAAVAAGSAGLGLACAKALAAEGVQVSLCGRDRAKAEAAAADIGAVALMADLSDVDQATGFIEQASEQLGGTIDIVVANAGGPPTGTFASTDLDGYRQAVELNLLSSIALCRAAVPAMQAQRWGRVVAITSIGVRQPPPYLMASATARAGLTAFLKVLATEVAPDGVTVNSAQPGMHDTDRVRQLHGGGTPPAEAAAGIPVGHLGDAEDFGAVVAFLCSQQARFVTGTSVLIDGGAFPGLV
ncbi:MAG TPA: SDR family oxidoreductase [Acidimicrobiales bacterium]